MIDFLMVSTRITKRGTIEIYPKFLIKRSHDLMTRGRDFYAIWIEERGLWSTNEDDALKLIDDELDKFAKENRENFGSNLQVLHMWDAETGMIDKWHHYCQKQLRDNFHMLDEKLIFANTETNKKDYASKRLNYALENGEITGYETLMSTLYTPEERHKLEWGIGSIVCGDSKKLQKFIVLYGAAGTGKSTVLNIIEQLFEGYCSVFDAKALGSSSNSFALEPFNTNPLVAIQHDGDLSKIEDNTRLNSLVSHEKMTVNEKFKSTYTNDFKCFLFMGTNKPVKITDAKSGLIRRLIDVSPSGDKLSQKDYKIAMKQVDFELGAIAYHCQEVYQEDPDAYNDYIPVSMLGASNDFYNFVMDSYVIFKKQDGTTLKAAWEMYKTYCDDAKVPYPLSQRSFKEELKNYFWDYKERFRDPEDDTRIRNYYSGFRADKFEMIPEKKPEESNEEKSWLILKEQSSIFDQLYKDCPAQYASTKEIPSKKWVEVTSKLKEVDTRKLHYVKIPEEHIVIDFDLKDKDGNKSYEKNLEEASKWPPTYAELSKSGAGVHLHYIYNGSTPSNLCRLYAEDIEVKVFTGNSSLRRKLTKCNDLPIATISSGLPLKGEKKVLNPDVVRSESALRKSIMKALNKEVHAGTKPNIDFIYHILDEAYKSGMKYDVSNMQNAIIAFAAKSTHQSDYCLELVGKMKFESDEPSESITIPERPVVVFDVEVFPNLFLVNYKLLGEGNPMVRLINPTPAMIEDLLQFRLIGFNCRRYDNHILYGCLNGYTNEQLYQLSQSIIQQKPNCFFKEAYNLSYTDIYNFASAGNKKSLKKFEIELHIHHQELGLPWDKPVDRKLWTKVAEYCDNDVLATEQVFYHLKGDWIARQILAELAGMTVNDTTNTLTTRFIFGKDRNPQAQFNYRDLSKPVRYSDEIAKAYDRTEFHVFDKDGQPTFTLFHPGDNLPEGYSILPFFPGYKFECGKSTYRGEEVGEGGYVYSEPGIHGNDALLDIASMHPHSAIAEMVFGPKYTRAFEEVVEGRVSIKHKAWDEVNNMLDGKLTPFIQKVIDGELSAKDLANALKTAINAVYGLTSAKFDNAFRDPRNKDNIIAKCGALFMINLKHEVQERGFTVAHIKTDSIKIPDATPEIIDFVMAYGKEYGYTFEHEATYDRMCLVNDAVYIAKYATEEKCMELYGYAPEENKEEPGQWTATGTQFKVPFVFKTLFSKEPIDIYDKSETMSVSTALYLDMKPDLPFDENGNSQDTETPQLRFIGKVGQFCPILPGAGGGELLREGTDKEGNLKYSSANGAKGYRWLETEVVKNLGKEEDIDISYYNNLVTDAAHSIAAYGDFEWFVSDDPYIGPEFKNGKPSYDMSEEKLMVFPFE